MHGIIKYSGVMFTLLSTLSSETLMAAGQQCFTLKNGHASFQLGGFWANPGNDQNINIKGLVGNHYSVRLHNSSKLITGLYYYLDGFHHEKFELTYGMNAFYLGPNSVSGNITQEQL